MDTSVHGKQRQQQHHQSHQTHQTHQSHQSHHHPNPHHQQQQQQQRQHHQLQQQQHQPKNRNVRSVGVTTSKHKLRNQSPIACQHRDTIPTSGKQFVCDVQTSCKPRRRNMGFQSLNKLGEQQPYPQQQQHYQYHQFASPNEKIGDHLDADDDDDLNLQLKDSQLSGTATSLSKGQGDRRSKHPKRNRMDYKNVLERSMHTAKEEALLEVYPSSSVTAVYPVNCNYNCCSPHGRCHRRHHHHQQQQQHHHQQQEQHPQPQIVREHTCTHPSDFTYAYGMEPALQSAGSSSVDCCVFHYHQHQEQRRRRHLQHQHQQHRCCCFSPHSHQRTERRCSYGRRRSDLQSDYFHIKSDKSTESAGMNHTTSSSATGSSATKCKPMVEHKKSQNHSESESPSELPARPSSPTQHKRQKPAAMQMGLGMVPKPCMCGPKIDTIVCPSEDEDSSIDGADSVSSRRLDFTGDVLLARKSATSTTSTKPSKSTPSSKSSTPSKCMLPTRPKVPACICTNCPNKKGYTSASASSILQINATTTLADAHANGTSTSTSSDNVNALMARYHIVSREELFRSTFEQLRDAVCPSNMALDVRNNDESLAKLKTDPLDEDECLKLDLSIATMVRSLHSTSSGGTDKRCRDITDEILSSDRYDPDREGSRSRMRSDLREQFQNMGASQMSHTMIPPTADGRNTCRRKSATSCRRAGTDKSQSPRKSEDSSMSMLAAMKAAHTTLYETCTCAARAVGKSIGLKLSDNEMSSDKSRSMPQDDVDIVLDILKIRDNDDEDDVEDDEDDDDDENEDDDDDDEELCDSDYAEIQCICNRADQSLQQIRDNMLSTSSDSNLTQQEFNERCRTAEAKAKEQPAAKQRSEQQGCKPQSCPYRSRQDKTDEQRQISKPSSENFSSHSRSIQMTYSVQSSTQQSRQGVEVPCAPHSSVSQTFSTKHTKQTVACPYRPRQQKPCPIESRSSQQHSKQSQSNSEHSSVHFSSSHQSQAAQPIKVRPCSDHPNSQQVPCAHRQQQPVEAKPALSAKDKAAENDPLQQTVNTLSALKVCLIPLIEQCTEASVKRALSDNANELAAAQRAAEKSRSRSRSRSPSEERRRRSCRPSCKQSEESVQYLLRQNSFISLDDTQMGTSSNILEVLNYLNTPDHISAAILASIAQTEGRHSSIDRDREQQSKSSSTTKHQVYQRTKKMSKYYDNSDDCGCVSPRLAHSTSSYKDDTTTSSTAFGVERRQFCTPRSHATRNPHINATHAQLLSSEEEESKEFRRRPFTEMVDRYSESTSKHLVPYQTDSSSWCNDLIEENVSFRELVVDQLFENKGKTCPCNAPREQQLQGPATSIRPSYGMPRSVVHEGTTTQVITSTTSVASRTLITSPLAQRPSTGSYMSTFDAVVYVHPQKVAAAAVATVKSQGVATSMEMNYVKPGPAAARDNALNRDWCGQLQNMPDSSCYCDSTADITMAAIMPPQTKKFTDTQATTSQSPPTTGNQLIDCTCVSDDEDDTEKRKAESQAKAPIAADAPQQSQDLCADCYCYLTDPVCKCHLKLNKSQAQESQPQQPQQAQAQPLDYPCANCYCYLTDPVCKCHLKLNKSQQQESQPQQAQQTQQPQAQPLDYPCADCYCYLTDPVCKCHMKLNQSPQQPQVQQQQTAQMQLVQVPTEQPESEQWEDPCADCYCYITDPVCKCKPEPKKSPPGQSQLQQSQLQQSQPQQSQLQQLPPLATCQDCTCYLTDPVCRCHAQQNKPQLQQTQSQPPQSQAQAQAQEQQDICADCYCYLTDPVCKCKAEDNTLQQQQPQAQQPQTQQPQAKQVQAACEDCTCYLTSPVCKCHAQLSKAQTQQPQSQSMPSAEQDKNICEECTCYLTSPTCTCQDDKNVQQQPAQNLLNAGQSAVQLARFARMVESMQLDDDNCRCRSDMRDEPIAAQAPQNARFKLAQIDVDSQYENEQFLCTEEYVCDCANDSQEPADALFYENLEEKVYEFPNGERMPIFTGCRCMIGQYILIAAMVLHIKPKNLDVIEKHLRNKIK